MSDTPNTPVQQPQTVERLPAEVIARHNLKPEEYAEIERRLGRPATLVELGVFSVLWSEHCSYKSTRAHFHLFPTTGPTVVLGPGENAGVVSIKDDADGNTWCAAFKMESHNHPSYIEPYQGAATGVGGILRDVFTMGARPTALLNCLRFGRPQHPRTPGLVRGVVHGIGGYGNCIGVPTIGGNVSFDACYDGNILVNAFALGIVRKDKIFLGNAEGVGNPVLYVGSATGRDGIHGATMASASFDEASVKRRPTVQVGDPFAEKLLLEACMEIFAEDWLVGIQDMGAAGLTSSSFEMASRSGSGIQLDLSAVPGRAANLTPYEILLSESQERMLMVARKGCEDQVLAVCKKWGLESAVIGTVTDTGRFVATFAGEVVLDVSVAAVVDDAPRYDRPRKEPADLAERRALDLSEVPDTVAWCDLTTLMGRPDIASKRWIWQQYDHMVGTNTVVLPGAADAAVLRVKECDALLALAADCTERYGHADPYACGVYAVAESVRNLACVGATPLGTTDCLNFGNPEVPEVMWGIREAMRGLGDAAKALDAPVVSGNASLYNSTNSVSILPTPMVAVVGKLPDGAKPVGMGFVAAGDEIWLLGRFRPSLGASRWLYEFLGRHQGQVSQPDLGAEKSAATLVQSLVVGGLLRSAHDLSDGGLAVALAESAVLAQGGPVGVDCEAPTAALAATERLLDRLFGETGASYVVSVAAGQGSTLAAAAEAAGVAVTRLGTVGHAGESFRLGSLIGPVAELAERFHGGFVQEVFVDSQAAHAGD